MSIPVGTWTHIAATFRAAASGGGTVVVYVNGVPYSTWSTLDACNNATGAIGTLNVSSQPLQIGREFPDAFIGDGRYFPGAIDDPRVYNRVLSDAEVAALANNFAVTVLPYGVLANDTDPDSPVLQAVLATPPSHGTLQLSADGSFTYAPAAGFSGVDTFTYTASDGVASSAPATVTITVNAIYTQQPFDLTSLLNADVIMNTSDALGGPNGEKTAMDGSAYVLMTQSYASAESSAYVGLPDNGSFAANADHPTVQLYATNAGDRLNARFSGTGGDTYTIAVPNRPYNQVQIYATATEAPGGLVTTFTLHYNDGTSDVRTITVPDWSTSAYAGEFSLVSGLDRHSVGDGATQYTHSQSIFGLNLNPNTSKILTSIDVSKPASGPRLVVFAAQGQ